MLFTRCPECETTFRVTDETLKKAHGQVRCGRCASVFNAYAELRDPNAKSFDRAEQPAPVATTRSDPQTGLAPADDSSPPPASATPGAPIADPPQARSDAASRVGEALAVSGSSEPRDPVAASLGIDSVADVVAEVEKATEASPMPPATPEGVGDAVSAPATSSGGLTSDDDADTPISAKEVDAVLTTPVALPAPKLAWSPFNAASFDPPRPSARWGAAAAVAALVLVAQVLHHYRTDLAGNPSVGAWVQDAYAVLGVEVRPHWDVRQYEILDWVATAEPNARGLGKLKITAHIQNRGPGRQPYPDVQLKLKDRWEDAVGRRLFTPAEYLPSDTPSDRLMSPGETARAEIEVIDPGPDAYGFELDVCIEVEASRVSCGTDAVFL